MTSRDPNVVAALQEPWLCHWGPRHLGGLESEEGSMSRDGGTGTEVEEQSSMRTGGVWACGDTDVRTLSICGFCPRNMECRGTYVVGVYDRDWQDGA